MFKMSIVVVTVVSDWGSIGNRCYVFYGGRILDRGFIMNRGVIDSQWGVVALIVTYDALGGHGVAEVAGRNHRQKRAQTYDLKF